MPEFLYIYAFYLLHDCLRDHADTYEEHDDGEDEHDGAGFGFIGYAGTNLCADCRADTDGKACVPEDVAEPAVGDDADGTGHTEYALAGRGRYVRRESEEEYHSRYVDDTAADAEDAGEESDCEAERDAEGCVIDEGVGIEARTVCFFGRFEVRKKREDHKYDTEGDSESVACEVVGYVAAEERAREGRKAEADGCVPIYFFLFDVSHGAGECVHHNAEERCADGMLRRPVIEHDEDGDEYDTAADADERTEHTDTRAKHEELDDVEDTKIHGEYMPPWMFEKTNIYCFIIHLFGCKRYGKTVVFRLFIVNIYQPNSCMATDDVYRPRTKPVFRQAVSLRPQAEAVF